MRTASLVLVLALSGAAHAHEDPSGRVHPHVVATAEGFEVFFSDNRLDDAITPGCLRARDPRSPLFGGEAVFRRRYTRQGEPVEAAKRLCPQEPREGKEAYDAWLRSVQGPWTYATAETPGHMIRVEHERLRRNSEIP